MRFSLVRGAAILGFVAIVCFCSCERHNAGELPAEPVADRASDAPAASDIAAPSPAARATPAEFFPKKTNP